MPQRSAALHQTPPPQGLAGRFGVSNPCRGAKPLPEQGGWLKDGVLGVCTTQSMRLASQPESRSRAAGRAGTRVGDARAYLWQSPTRRAPVPRVPRALATPKFLLLLLRNLYLLLWRGSPCPPSLPQLARLFHLKEKEREGKKRRGGGEKRNKIKSKGGAGLCWGWAAAKPSPCSSSASQQGTGQPPAHLGGGPAASGPSVEQSPGLRDVHRV